VGQSHSHGHIHLHGTHGHGGQATSPEAVAMRQAIYRTSDPKRLDNSMLPDSGDANPLQLGDRQHLIFYQDEGGLRATDEGNEVMDTIYYLGVIDILTPYGVGKKVEHFWKSLNADRVSGFTNLSF
jgi:1-phosphatidylinositol-4-phosphate 5-kinase